jgi:hypothetical protein
MSAFNNSQKTHRTPVKMNQENEGQESGEKIGLEDFKEVMMDMKSQIVAELTIKMNENSKSVEEAVKSQKDYEKKSNKKFTNLEFELKRKNVIVKGLEEKEENLEQLETMVISLIRDKIGVELSENDIDIVKRLGEASDQKIRPVIIKLHSEKKKIFWWFWVDRPVWSIHQKPPINISSRKIPNMKKKKIQIMEKKNVLKGTEIFIDPDLPKEKLERAFEKRKQKREKSKEKKEAGKKRRRRHEDEKSGQINKKVMRENESSSDISDEDFEVQQSLE